MNFSHYLPPYFRNLGCFFAPLCLGTWGAIGGAAVSVIGGAVVANNTKKRTPDTVDYKPVDLQAEQTKAIQGNLSNENSIENLLSRSNKFAQTQASDLMEQAIPGYTKFAQGLLKSGQQALDNPYAVPQDVQDNLTRIAAERGISRGTRGQFNQYSALRDLGVNMLDYGNANFNRAVSALSAVSGTAPRINPMSPMSFYVTPGQAIQNTTNNNTQAQAIGQGAANAQAGTTNYNQQNLWDSISKGIGMIDWGGVSKGKTGTPQLVAGGSSGGGGGGGYGGENN